MQVNPDNFQEIPFGRTSQLVQNFTVENAQIECSETVDTQLKFQKH